MQQQPNLFLEINQHSHPVGVATVPGENHLVTVSKVSQSKTYKQIKRQKTNKEKVNAEQSTKVPKKKTKAMSMYKGHLDDAAIAI